MPRYLIILLVAGAVVAVFLVVVAMQPSTYHVQRSMTIFAPPAMVFAQVNDFHKWEPWSPWAKLDPTMKTTYEGAPAGTGAAYAWEGNSKVGAGRMTLAESRPNDLIKIKMDFIRPFAGVAAVDFTFVPHGNQTLVTWSMSGDLVFATKAFSLFMSMDKMIGRDFEKGLAGIKAVAEGAAK